MEPLNVRHARLRANGIEFHVALAGSDAAPLLLCLHGFPECWYSWRYQLARLSDRYLVAAPDLRGYGETEKPAGGYELRSLAADAAGLIHALGRERAYVVGHDWGGFIAYAAAAYHKDAVERLLVMSCPHPASILRGLPSFDQLRRSWYIYVMLIPGLVDWRLSRDGAAILPRIFMGGARHRENFRPDDLETLRASFARPGTAKAALAYYRVNLSPLGLLLGRMNAPPVEVPTLVLLGRDDPWVGPTLFERHGPLFRGPYRMQSIPNCGHWLQQEVPELANEAILGLSL